MPLMNALFLLLCLSGAVFSASKGAIRAVFGRFYAVPVLYSSSFFYVFMVQFLELQRG